MANTDNSLLRYQIPCSSSNNPHITELTIKKSRFLTQACHCESAEQARSFIAKMRNRNFGASHNCWAFTCLAPGLTGLAGSSDDGEPHGTAGRPMLQALLNSETGEICVVVSRWFGGIKLGAGGLCRAYRQAVLENLETLPKKEKLATKRLEISFPYAFVSRIKNFLQSLGDIIAEERYETDVSFTINLPLDKKDGFTETLTGLSNGSVKIREL